MPNSEFYCTRGETVISNLSDAVQLADECRLRCLDGGEGVPTNANNLWRCSNITSAASPSVGISRNAFAAVQLRRRLARGVTALIHRARVNGVCESFGSFTFYVVFFAREVKPSSQILAMQCSLQTNVA